VSISKKPKEIAYLKKIIKEQEKTKYDSSSVHSNDERWMRLLEAQYAFAQRFKEKMREGIESSGSNTYDDAVLPNNSQGRTHSMQKMSTKQEYTSTQSETPFANKTKEEICIEISAIQQANILKLIRKDNKRQMYKMYEESESNISSNRGPISKMPKENAYLKELISSVNTFKSTSNFLFYED
ncbi:hypothetical protein STEG23_028495, partial [Scotinomys teguina]